MTIYRQPFPSDFFDLVFQDTIQRQRFDIEVRILDDSSTEQHFYRSKKQFEKAWKKIEEDSRLLEQNVIFTVVLRLRSQNLHKEHRLQLFGLGEPDTFLLRDRRACDWQRLKRHCKATYDNYHWC